MNALVPSRHQADETADVDVSRRIARGWSGAALPLGLDEPFRLLGGDALAPDGLPLELMLDWAPGLQSAAIEACMHQSLDERPWFTMPPLALIGLPGIGRTLMARRLARCAGVPFACLDVSGSMGTGSLRNGRRPPDAPFVSEVVVTMATSRCANPVILVTGIDRAEDATIDLVQRMTDPASSPRWVEQDIGATVDLGQITWLIQADLRLGLSGRLSHLRPVEIRIEDMRDRGSRSMTILSELLDDHALDRHDLGCSPAALLDHIDRVPSATAADRYRAGAKALATVAGRCG